jgi:hypothetical protein
MLKGELIHMSNKPKTFSIHPDLEEGLRIAEFHSRKTQSAIINLAIASFFQNCDNLTLVAIGDEYLTQNPSFLIDEPRADNQEAVNE